MNDFINNEENLNKIRTITENSLKETFDDSKKFDIGIYKSLDIIYSMVVNIVRYDEYSLYKKIDNGFTDNLFKSLERIYGYLNKEYVKLDNESSDKAVYESAIIRIYSNFIERIDEKLIKDDILRILTKLMFTRLTISTLRGFEYMDLTEIYNIEDDIVFELDKLSINIINAYYTSNHKKYAIISFISRLNKDFLKRNSELENFVYMDFIFNNADLYRL